MGGLGRGTTRCGTAGQDVRPSKAAGANTPLSFPAHLASTKGPPFEWTRATAALVAFTLLAVFAADIGPDHFSQSELNLMLAGQPIALIAASEPRERRAPFRVRSNDSGTACLGSLMLASGFTTSLGRRPGWVHGLAQVGFTWLWNVLRASALFGSK